jgi:hypothetical protein
MEMENEILKFSSSVSFVTFQELNIVSYVSGYRIELPSSRAFPSSQKVTLDITDRNVHCVAQADLVLEILLPKPPKEIRLQTRMSGCFPFIITTLLSFKCCHHLNLKFRFICR